MGKLLKTAMAAAICGLVLSYALGTAYLDDAYGKKIDALDRDIALFIKRYRQLEGQKTQLEAAQADMQAQLALEQEKVRLMREAVSSGPAKVQAASVSDGVNEAVKIQAAYVKPKETALAEQLTRLQEARQQAQIQTKVQAKGQPKVTSAS
ncbi:MAG: hypothetical protein V1875_05050 [Candidatus Altiarchaeota archaeon]